MDENDSRYKPISPFGYIGFQILFAIPVIGLIAVILISLIARNKNTRNFAVSQLIMMILVMLLVIILATVMVLSGMTPEDLIHYYSSRIM